MIQVSSRQMQHKGIYDTEYFREFHAGKITIRYCSSIFVSQTGRSEDTIAGTREQ